MKKHFKYIMLGLLVIGASSCKKFLDINKNPNSLTEATPALVLPQAIVGSAAIGNNFNISFADFSGARANAGGFGGFGSVVTYDFTNLDYQGLWTSSYDNANDFQYIIDNTGSTSSLVFSTSIARIMKALTFERLVNQFNDVPYSEALKGTAILQPKYDKAEDVYKASISDLDKAIADIAAGQAQATTAKIVANTDPLFKGDMDLWKKFANTIKLRMLIKMAGVPALQSYTATAFGAMNTTVGFLTTDAIVNPGYEKTVRPNPVYNSIGFTTTGTNTTTSRIPSRWIYSFYTGAKLSDPGRGSVIYRAFPSSIINQLGDESSGVPSAPSAGSSWITGDNSGNYLGVVKGPTQGQPILLAAESKFLQAEAFVRGYLSGNAATAFNDGITLSFTYLYKNVSNVVDPSKNVSADVTTYLTTNAASPLANYALATTLDQKIEAIITQKYIALNMISNDEAFNEFRRTMFPKIVNGSLDPLQTFASRQSVSTHVDKLPTRVLYPATEFSLNTPNVPTNINKFSSLIFWDLN
ncbi:SusD/RagB family nutrient-binding outer membrane lipoprotein [Pedobacter sandarakinus]|uniref:SusD/RagB family nutrient-binding outer membrane lipoprotein n=1 Tax=Pedobacter sandarakinus TaxID=353156 RepID=UPI0022479A6E|nr:SusD/RagB family nutrient-binding outer membrane lipoprotein [Pedobacter sandarakinus]MCX2573675.1 SusD/RagB family nutrient-binding outer membrane lipoprotein [Pedobacter sandarakinus]